MITFANIVLEPGAIAAWIVVGLFLGWLAGKVMEAPSYGVGGDLFLGAMGALAGGLLFGYFVAGDPGFWGSFLVAAIGACIVVGGARAVVAMRSA